MATTSRIGSAGRCPPSPPISLPLGLDEQGIVAKVQLGEGVGLELKPFIDLSSGKAPELVRTAMAFANTEGGEIVVGVSDDLTISGIDVDVMRHSQKPAPPPSECIEKYRGAVVAAIKDRVVPSIDVEAVPVRIRDRTVLVVRVPKGDGPPRYDVHERRVYVRRGANNMLADPASDLPRLYSGTPLAAWEAAGLFRPQR